MVRTSMRVGTRMRLRASVSDGKHSYEGEDEGEVEGGCE